MIIHCVTCCSFARRPASNMDPYVVTALIFDTVCLGGKTDAFAAK
jgi:hypothetical protein